MNGTPRRLFDDGLDVDPHGMTYREAALIVLAGALAAPVVWLVLVAVLVGFGGPAR